MFFLHLEHLTTPSVVEFPNSKGFLAHKQSSSSNFRGYQTNSRGCSGRIGRGRSSFGGRNYFSSRAGSKLLCQICGKSGHSAIKCYHMFNLNCHNQSESSKGSVNTGDVVCDFSQFQSSQAYIDSPKDVDDASWFLDKWRYASRYCSW